MLGIALRVDLLPNIATQLSNTYIRHQPVATDRIRRADEISVYLKAHLEPGDTVQALDWVRGGVLQGMLMADARQATPFIYDEMFYHHVTDPYIQSLREQFIHSLNDVQPRFIVDYGLRPWIAPPYGSGEFTELQLLIATHYAVAQSQDDYTIYENTSSWFPETTQAIVVYPARPADIADWFAKVTGSDIIPVSQSSLEAGSVEQLLKQTAATHKLLTMVFVNQAGADPSHKFEAWLNRNSFRLSEQWAYRARALHYLAASPDCLKATPRQATFGDSMTLKSADSGVVQIENSRFVCVRLEWQAERQISISYKVAAHVVNGSGEVIAQYDSVPVGYLAPTTTWTPGQPVVDQFAIRLPDGTPPGQYTVRILVYNEVTQERLRVSSERDKPDFIKIGAFNIVDK